MTQTVSPRWRTVGEQAAVWPGRNWPLGATWSAESTNFAVHAPDATRVWVCLFDEDDVETRHELGEHSLGIWHGALPGLVPGQRYGFRADGPWEPGEGRVFNPAKLLADPYARALSGTYADHQATYGHRRDPAPAAVADLVRDDADSAPYVGRSVVVHDDFDWGGDAPIRRRWRDTVVYELHVKGFTALHDRIPEHLRGTYAGLGHPVVTEYLTDLGVTAVELLPVHAAVSEPHLTQRGQVNYWGYNSLGFFAPSAAYASGGDRGQQVREFKEMVKALHASGIEVLLDVVYNHTAEAGPTGRTLSWRGLDDLGYYQRADLLDAAGEPVLEPDGSPVPDPTTYWDVTGCGNTVAAYRPHVLRLILDSLRYWVTEMHVDGFRFDLMSALARTGHDVDLHGQVLGAMGQDPVLRHVKLVAEPWDCSSEGYQVGRFPPPWTEWNDRFRDTVRDFWRSSGDGIRSLATRLAGSSDLYADDGRSPSHSVNYVTAHDGFTVRDLVSYAHKHNEANGEDNRDGTDDNRSSNGGVEGETDDPEVLALRRRQAANLMVTLCLSAGVPMLTAGDERGRTQRGNNNAYGQDNEISWVDWRAEDAWLDVYDVTRAALRIRRAHRTLRQRHFFEGRPTIEGGPKDLAWVHPEGRELVASDWEDPGLQVLGMFVSGDPLRSPGPRGEQQWDSSFLLWVNGSAQECTVLLPENRWVRRGTVALSTDGTHAPGTPVEAGQELVLAPRALLLLQQSPAGLGGMP